MVDEEAAEDETKQDEWCARITRIENGYLVEHEGEYGGMIKHAIVEPEMSSFKDIPGEIQAARELAYYIWEHFGFYPDKWGEHNLRVRIEPGHKLNGWKPEDGDEDYEEEVSKDD
jgi:hypothetical protein